jgi:Thiolase, N-terminal domain/Thiolase, C-terminal domain
MRRRAGTRKIWCANIRSAREAQDQWALRSQQRYAAAQAAGRFKSEIVPVEIPGRKGATTFETDEHNRPKTTLEALAALKPAFRPDGTITAGNAPGINSGAAAVILTDRGWAAARGLDPVARLVSYGIAAVEPGMFGLGPVPAVRQALDRAGWTLGDIERIAKLGRLSGLSKIHVGNSADAHHRYAGRVAVESILRRQYLKIVLQHYWHAAVQTHRSAVRNVALFHNGI